MSELTPLKLRCRSCPLSHPENLALPACLYGSGQPPGERRVLRIGGSFPFLPFIESAGPRVVRVWGQEGNSLPFKGGEFRVFPPKTRGKNPREKKNVEPKKGPPKRAPETPKKRGPAVGGGVFFPLRAPPPPPP
eukprot:FR737722.1.p2 GENE.FR737722.1~~FR737722.1.p2  ORF type:complete len:134 (+),score=62.19 FR737722.1:788-1189(+)